jgi:hypothetical protein
MDPAFGGMAVRLEVRTGTSPVSTKNFSTRRFFQHALTPYPHIKGLRSFESNDLKSSFIHSSSHLERNN